ncbi:ClpXP protease specificity-enhancing factor [Roseateles sp. BYS180W]|uniref:ClpXP protease specificity-enhancing factor n=1 Tax=Roseateles rivi TaxID=3299028 RepID=A0ABW7FW23_9BURK
MNSGNFSEAGGGSSTRPYLIRALHEWCTDNGFTPYLAVHVDARVQVPREYVNNGEIVLNVSFDATSHLDLGNEYIRFKARFGGVPRDIAVPVEHVVAIYARENGQGMAFPKPLELGIADGVEPAVDSSARAEDASTAPTGLRLAPNPTLPAPDMAAEPADGPGDDIPPPTGGRPALKRVK